MAYNNTYVALDKITVSGSSTGTITFNSIPSTYTDLVIVVNAGVTTGAQDLGMTLNNNTSTSVYSNTKLWGTGSTAGSGRANGSAYTTLTSYGYLDATLNQNTVVNIMNYSNTTTYKTVLARANNAGNGTSAQVCLYQSTAAITRVDLFPLSGVNFISGSTFSLYGIRAEGTSPAAKATGGTIYSDSQYYYHVFGSTGTFTPLQSLTADVLVVAGGGGAGANGGAGGAGGGGAGGVAYYASQSLIATGYTCTVGAGGATVSGDRGASGANSQFSTLTAAVGGGGGGRDTDTTGASSFTGRNGGSGGGGGINAATGAYAQGGTGTSGQGNNGGRGWNAPGSGGGGGGAGATGSNTVSQTVAGAGGNGTSAYSSWLQTINIGQNVSGTWYIAGGGGGGAGSDASNSPYTGGAAGYGGGGNGWGTNQSSTAGSVNSGGGGGAGGYGNYGAVNGPSQAGGSGVVIVRYLKA